ncbi:MAG TPA: DUF2723 domain-containing protein [Ignavibacteriaceae bacterium]|jgi:hypothetical protein|nr:MAG: hypothetical protein BWY38_02402 [Ignavibacteria bacterium ADurb.Bin266]OQY71760.1 MAG: hypothetical protein B6D44_11870 [Ignavibacteriales bacterium UTCHB2]HQF42809.1 DUF2723 domain-containing protein [Ignavibacteriaceae bacterium]HQI41503.1 DUF2723 domain-containing protein [Ignavibacteriaceae bacterium]
MQYLKKYYFILTGLAAFIIYILTLAPSVIEIDTGELATVQITLGIAHPTGYPLYTMLGYLFSLLPFPFSKIFQMNLLAAVYCSAAVATFTYTSKLVLDNLNQFQYVKIKKEKSGKKSKGKKEVSKTTSPQFEISETLKILSSTAGGLFLAFSKTFWFQSTSVEVYSLHLLLISIIILVLLKAYLFAKQEKAVDKFWIFFAIALAFGFSNHMTTLWIIPATAFLYFSQNKFTARSIKQIGIMLIIFFPLLILIYSYLPIRASQSPLLNWGNPVDWERIIRHISGKQYQVWLFSSTAAASKQFKYFINNLTSEFSISLLIIALGLFVSFIKARKFFVFNIVIFLTTVLLSINYDINDIDSYFLLAYISLAFFAVFGAVYFLLFTLSRKINLSVSVIVLAVVLFIQLYGNFNSVNQSNNHIYEDYTKSLINSVPKNSIIFSYQWDYFISASYYFQIVEKFRDDVIIIDKELLRRSWYYKQLNTNYPGLLSGVNRDVEQFLEALKPFERDENFNVNANLLESLYKRIMTELVLTNIEKHDYFVAPELIDGEMRRGEFQLPSGYTLVPYLFLFKVVNTNDYVEAPLPDYKIRFNEVEDKYQTALKGFISSMLIRRAMYELQFQKIDFAKTYVKKLKVDFPDVSLPAQLSGFIE